MLQEDNQAAAKAKAFFDKAGKVAETKNFDYAIDMYLEGLRCVPDALQEGHLPLRHLALQRKEKSGKKPKYFERLISSINLFYTFFYFYKTQEIQ